MKIKNIMFSGAMASILMMGGASAAADADSALATAGFVRGAYNSAVEKALTNVAAVSGSGITVSAPTANSGAAATISIGVDTDVIATKSSVDAKQDKLPTMANNGGKVLKVNSAGTGVEWSNDIDTKVTLQSTTGNSTTDGMTQKAITDALALKANDATVTAIDDRVDSLETTTAGHTTILNRLDGAVTTEGSVKYLIKAEEDRAKAAEQANATAAANAKSAADAAQSTANTAVTNAATADAKAVAAQNVAGAAQADVDALEEVVADKQDTLTTAQLAAVNSGITNEKVTKYEEYSALIAENTTAISDETTRATNAESALDERLDTLEGNAAVNSGITAAKVGGYDEHLADTDIHVTAAQKTAWNAKQDALTEAQANAVNSGITAAKVTKYDGYEAMINGKANSATSLAGYGITDAYTKTEVNTELAKKQDKLTSDNAGNNVSISTDAQGKVTITAVDNDTTYTAGTGITVDATAHTISLGYAVTQGGFTPSAN